MLEMGPFLDRRASDFSTGMSQKTSIARSIIHNPSVLLLDEPSSGLDVTASRNIYRFIRMYRDLGKTVLFSSHDMEAAGRICDRVIIIHRGEIRPSINVQKESCPSLLPTPLSSTLKDYLQNMAISLGHRTESWGIVLSRPLSNFSKIIIYRIPSQFHNLCPR